MLKSACRLCFYQFRVGTVVTVIFTGVLGSLVIKKRGKKSYIRLRWNTRDAS